jgi:hypothetical protein
MRCDWRGRFLSDMAASSECTQSRAGAGSLVCALAPKRYGTRDTWLVSRGPDLCAIRVAGLKLRCRSRSHLKRVHVIRLLVVDFRRGENMFRRPAKLELPKIPQTKAIRLPTSGTVSGKTRTACMKHDAGPEKHDPGLNDALHFCAP